MTTNSSDIGKKGIQTLFSLFLNSERSGGYVLILCTILSVIAANSFFSENYASFFHHAVTLSPLNTHFEFSIHHIVNDGLMTIFFLVVGLEIERELYIGELSNFRQALLPIIAAIGGMVIPALIHYTFNKGTVSQSGFGIPMATDIAFSLAALALLGKRIPFSLKIFLTAFAIIDDLGAVAVIALFYSKGISLLYISLAAGSLGVLIVLNRLKVFKIAPYIIIGFVLWYFILKSGIHPTITGVFLAFAIPFTRDAGNPSLKVLKFLRKPVTFIILPIFAIVNTAIPMSFGSIAGFVSHNSAGIILGLVFGKPAGIFLASALSIKLKLCTLPNELGFRHILGAGMFGGIGFTMSIFIANLAFTDIATINSSIIATIAGSVLSGIIGVAYFMAIKTKVPVVHGTTYPPGYGP